MAGRTAVGGSLEPLDPFAEGFAYAARRLQMALGGDVVSPRTELFRPLPDDPMAWLLKTFPTYFQTAAGVPVPLAPHHEDFWDWLWALRPGWRSHPFISILARGGGKSTQSELGAGIVGYFGLRRYGLYISDTQKQADQHVATVAKVFEILGVDRAVNRYGFSLGWNINRLSTADGYTLDAIGMDAASRGVKRDETRPDLIILDDVDKQLDSLETIAKKIELLTQTILPTAAGSVAVVGVQNIPNRDGIFAQMVDGRAEFLWDRQISGPHPALRGLPETDWYAPTRLPDGRLWRTILGGEPVWAGQDHAACEALLNLIGPRAFQIECLHAIGKLEGKVFKKEWFPIVTDWPRDAVKVRYWDFAATEEPKPGSRRTGVRDPDWTVGLLLAMRDGQFWVVDVQRVRLSPFAVEALVHQTALMDGRGVAIWLEEEGGASGKSVSAHYRQFVLKGFNVHTWHSTGSKGERAKPVASAAEAGNVFLVQGHWNQAFLDEVPRFLIPGVHDDQVDALAGAHYGLTLGQTILRSDFSFAPALSLGMTQRGVAQRAQHAAILPVHAALGATAYDPYLARLMALAGVDEEDLL